MIIPLTTDTYLFFLEPNHSIPLFLVLGEIRSTIGKAQLLIDQRFKQFSGLVDNCEFGSGEKETNPSDLTGFWDMIFFQVAKIRHNVIWKGLR